jgi:hypothetical protein
MKKFISSACIGLILLNVMGYYIVFVGLQHNHERSLMQQFDAGLYSIDEVETLKIPFDAQDGFSSEQFKRVDGHFQKDGQIYRLIKQRHFRDTFHIVYIKDKIGTLLNLKVKRYVETFSQTSSQEDTGVTEVPLFIKEYFTRQFSIQSELCGWESSVLKQSPGHPFISTFSCSIIHPPEKVGFLI